MLLVFLFYGKVSTLAVEACVSDTKCKWRSSSWFDVEPIVSHSFERKKRKCPEMSSGLCLGGISVIKIQLEIKVGTIRTIIDDYENLIKTRVIIPLDNGDIIKFIFHPQDLPHLLGLQHLIDIPELFEYGQNRLSATALYKGMCTGSYDIESYEKSTYYPELYKNRIQYFTSGTILDIIKAKQIVRFDPRKIKGFSTKMEKLEYMFWKLIRDENNNFGYFGIGFMAAGNQSDENYPNTFFFRADDQYIWKQIPVLPTSLMITDKNKKIFLAARLDMEERVLLPSEVRTVINEYRQGNYSG